MILNILLTIIILCAIALWILLKIALKKGNINAQTANENRYQASKAILENKDVYSKYEIQKAQQFVDSYLEKRL